MAVVRCASASVASTGGRYLGSETRLKYKCELEQLMYILLMTRMLVSYSTVRPYPSYLYEVTILAGFGVLTMHTVDCYKGRPG